MESFKDKMVYLRLKNELKCIMILKLVPNSCAHVQEEENDFGEED